MSSSTPPGPDDPWAVPAPQEPPYGQGRPYGQAPYGYQRVRAAAYGQPPYG